jgi:hypothetical protein
MYSQLFLGLGFRAYSLGVGCWCYTTDLLLNGSYRKEAAPADVVTLLAEEYFTFTASLPQFFHASIAQVFKLFLLL